MMQQLLAALRLLDQVHGAAAPDAAAALRPLPPMRHLPPAVPAVADVWVASPPQLPGAPSERAPAAAARRLRNAVAAPPGTAAAGAPFHDVDGTHAARAFAETQARGARGRRLAGAGHGLGAGPSGNLSGGGRRLQGGTGANPAGYLHGAQGTRGADPAAAHHEGGREG